MRVRPHIEKWLATATDEQRFDVDEFIGILNGNGDSGSLYNTLEACIGFSSLEYVKECLATIEWNGGPPQ